MFKLEFANILKIPDELPDSMVLEPDRMGTLFRFSPSALLLKGY
jgi:hypothetical protein